MSEYIICVRCHKQSCSDYDGEFKWEQRAARDNLCGELCDKCSNELRELLISFIGIKEEGADDK